MNIKYLIIILFLILGNVLAVSVNYNETIDISKIKNIDKIYAHGNELFITFNSLDSVWRYQVDYEKLELERIKSFGNGIGTIKDMWITDDIAYILDSSNVYKINYKTRKELFKGNSDSYFPSSPYAITIENNGEYIYLIDKENDRITIMYEYDEDKYLSKGSIGISTHGVTANFKELYDMLIYDNKMYVLDRELKQIFVYDSEEPYEYLDVYANGKAGYSAIAPKQIEMDEYFMYILEDYQKNITLMDKITGEKVITIKPECESEIEKFAYANDTLYILCSNKEELIIYNVDKRTTKTKEQVNTLYNDIVKRIEISCELYDASLYFEMKVENKCKYFLNETKNYSYINCNDAYDELFNLNMIVEGYNSGVKSQINGKIEKNVSFYLNNIFKDVPYTGTRNYTATRLIWDLQEIIEFKEKNEYSNIIQKMDNIMERYNDFKNKESTTPEDDEDENEEEDEGEEIEIQNIEIVKILNEFEYYKKLMENYSYFEMKILDFENVILEINNSENETLIINLKNEFEKLKTEYLEYDENYKKVSENLNETEQQYEILKSKMFVNTKEIELKLSCAKDNWENNPKEAWVCLEEAENLIEMENVNAENNFFLGIFSIGFLFVGFIFVVLVGIGLYKFIKRKKK